MWFDDDIPRRWGAGATRRSRRTSVLSVRVRKNKGKGRISRRAALAVLVPVVAAGVLVLAWFGLKLVGRVLFSGNDRYTITSLEIRDTGSIARFFIRERKGIKEGTNLFGFSARKTRREFLQQRYAAKYKSMDITRRLPGTLVVSVVERTPMARLGSRGRLVVDTEGCVFGLKPSARGLPVISGYRDKGLKPGDRVSGAALSALQVLEACDDPRLSIRVRSIDVSRKEHLAVYLHPGSKARGFRLSWKGMGKRGAKSEENLRLKLRRVKQTLAMGKTRGHSMLDATFDDKIFSRL